MSRTPGHDVRAEPKVQTLTQTETNGEDDLGRTLCGHSSPKDPRPPV